MKNKTVITLTGKSGCGKTTTINMLKDIFTGKNVEEIPQGKFRRQRKDIVFVFRYKNRIIALISAGDNEYILKNFFEKIETDYDICVCATRSKGNTKEFIRNLFDSVVEINKGKVLVENCPFIDSKKLEEEHNMAHAEAILKIIDKLCED